MIKNNSLFKNISILFLLIPMLLLSLFVMVPKREKINVYADSTVIPFTFVGSRVFVPCTSYESNGTTINRQQFLSVQINFSYSNGVYSFVINSSRLPREIESNPTLTTNDVLSADLVLDITSHYAYNGKIVLTSSVGVPVLVSIGNVDSSIVSPKISSSINRVQFFFTHTNNISYQHIRYYDISNNYIDFSFKTSATTSNLGIYADYGFSDRTYYININNLTDDTYYDQGYDDGYSQGLVDGNNEGYNEGYNVGKDFGYNIGYSDGIEDGGEFTFTSLFGAVIDVPVNAFTSLLNFKILGVNILGFISGLLTLALIIFIIKLCIGGK